MKKFLVAGIAAAAFCAAPAFAADMPVKAPAMVAPVWNWTGFYLGGQAGYGWGKSSYNLPATGFSISWSATGGFGGIFGGYNYQVNNIVFGIQGEYNVARIDGSIVNGSGHLQTSKLNNLGSIDGRVGFAFGRSLVYAIGGVSFWDPKQTFNTVGVGTVAFSGGNKTGWDIGGGLEYAFLGNWTGRIEYRHYDFGSATVPADGVIIGAPHIQKETLNTVRAGIAYKY
jgi:outer membrane immunogenic protein